jgi:flagellar assembly protein FliH
MNRVIRTARISSKPVVLPIHVDRGMVELPFESEEETVSEEDFEAAQNQDVEESVAFRPLGEQVEVVDETEAEPKLSMEEVEGLIEARLREAEAQFLQEKEQAIESAHQAGVEAGHAQGYEEGYQVGLAEGQTQSQDEIARFQAMLGYLADRWDRIFKSADMDVTQLAFAIAQNIIGAVSDVREDLVLQSVRDCLAHVQDTKQLTICVNPDDLVLVRANRTHWQESYERIESMIIEADASIERGGCIIETPSGDIDGQLVSRIEKLRGVILESLQNEPQETAPDVSDVIANVGGQGTVEFIDENVIEPVETVPQSSQVADAPTLPAGEDKDAIVSAKDVLSEAPLSGNDIESLDEVTAGVEMENVEPVISVEDVTEAESVVAAESEPDLPTEAESADVQAENYLLAQADGDGQLGEGDLAAETVTEEVLDALPVDADVADGEDVVGQSTDEVELPESLEEQTGLIDDISGNDEEAEQS